MLALHLRGRRTAAFTAVVVVLPLRTVPWEAAPSVEVVVAEALRVDQAAAVVVAPHTDKDTGTTENLLSSDTCSGDFLFVARKPDPLF